MAVKHTVKSSIFVAVILLSGSTAKSDLVAVSNLSEPDAGAGRGITFSLGVATAFQTGTTGLELGSIDLRWESLFDRTRY